MTYVDLGGVEFFPVRPRVHERVDGARNEIGMGDLGLALSARGRFQDRQKTAEGRKGDAYFNSPGAPSFPQCCSRTPPESQPQHDEQNM